LVAEPTGVEMRGLSFEAPSFTEVSQALQHFLETSFNSLLAHGSKNTPANLPAVETVETINDKEYSLFFLIIGKRIHLISFSCFADPINNLSNSGSSGRGLVCHTPISQCLNQCPPMPFEATAFYE
jgi:hypothetical protein